MQKAAMYAADWLLIPCATDGAAVEGLAGIMAILRAINERGGHCQILNVLPTFYDEVTRESRDTLAQPQRDLGNAVWNAIHRAMVLRECAAEPSVGALTPTVNSATARLAIARRRWMCCGPHLLPRSGSTCYLYGGPLGENSGRHVEQLSKDYDRLGEYRIERKSPLLSQSDVVLCGGPSSMPR
jgi:hypothetical protein